MLSTVPTATQSNEQHCFLLILTHSLRRCDTAGDIILILENELLRCHDKLSRVIKGKRWTENVKNGDRFREINCSRVADQPRALLAVQELITGRDPTSSRC